MNKFNSIKYIFFISICTLLLSCSFKKGNISGKLLGMDGKPIIFSHVSVIIPFQGVNSDSIIHVEQIVPINKNGNFNINVEHIGAALLEFSAPLHKRSRIPIYNSDDSKLQLKVHLAPISKNENLSQLAVIGNFNHFNRINSIPMKMNEDGIYTCKINFSDDILTYQLVNYRPDQEYINVKYPGEGCCNPSEKEFLLDNQNRYVSVVNTKQDSVTILVDPTLLKTKKEHSSWSIIKAEGEAKIFSEAVYVFEQMVNKYTAERLEQKKEFADSSAVDKMRHQYDWDAFYKSILDIVENKNLSKGLKQSLLAYYVNLGGSMSETDYNALNIELCNQAVATIPPTSLLWELFANGINNLRWTHHHNHINSFESYLDILVNKHQNDILKKMVLGYEVTVSTYEEKDERVAKYANFLIEQYPESTEAKTAIEFIGSKNLFKTVPNFSIADIENPSIFHSKKSLIGKYYLIDIWGTWCMPCIAEMPFLHSAYKKYNNENFTILSLAWDKSSQVVQSFRSKKWKMPWNNGLIEGYGNSKESSTFLEKFKVTGFPTTMLVSPDGDILARGSSLRGEKLDKTLSKYLSK